MKPIVSICAMAAMMFSAVAWANPPETVPIEEEVIGEVTWDCGDFLLMTDYRVEGYVRTYFNHDGSTSRQFWNLDFDAMSYNGSDPSRWLTGTGEHRQTWVHYENGVPIDAHHMGPSMKVTVPGYGVVLLDTGRATYDFGSGEFTFEAGPHWFDEGAFDAICAVLRP